MLANRAAFSDSDLLLAGDNFQLRLANNKGTQLESSVLVERMYAWRGYKAGQDSENAPPACNELTLQACSGRRVFGTLTVRTDSSEGLAADTLYRQEIDAFRQAGGCVAELTRLAVDPEHGSKEVLGALFNAAYAVCGPLRGVDDVFIEVNPRHVSFYRRMLNFRPVGEEKICPRVDAPAMLLHVKVAHVGEQAALYGGTPGEGNARSLYPYFCARDAAEELIRRVLAIGARQEEIAANA